MPVELTFRQVLQIAAVGFALYFPSAIYLQSSYTPQPAQPAKTWLTGPFIHLGGAAYIAYLPKHDATADQQGDPWASDLVIFENDEPLGPPHSVHLDIIDHGGGRFSHWKGQGLIFSASDNSDPNQNWKRYSVKIVPPSP